MADDEWRNEADDEWLASHRSTFMRRLRERFRGLAAISGAVSNAEMGPYGGAPRNPKLKTDEGNKAYSMVRYTTEHVAYTATATDTNACRRCGEPLAETHELHYVRGEELDVPVGAIRTCERCQTNSWMLRSNMPRAEQARATARRNVV